MISRQDCLARNARCSPFLGDWESKGSWVGWLIDDVRIELRRWCPMTVALLAPFDVGNGSECEGGSIVDFVMELITNG